MWFKILALTLCFVFISKSLIGLLFHRSFYQWDKKQYSQNRPPSYFKFLLMYGGVITTAAWYATLFHYVKYGWIITALTTLGVVKMINITTNWKRFSKGAVNLIDNHDRALWFLDVTLLILGSILFILAIKLYH